MNNQQTIKVESFNIPLNLEIMCSDSLHQLANMLNNKHNRTDILEGQF